MALGALAREVLLMIVGRAVALAAAGLLVGVILALALGRVIRGQLFGVSLVDPVTVIAVALVLGASACFASFLPAWRASKLDPGNALREGLSRGIAGVYSLRIPPSGAICAARRAGTAQASSAITAITSGTAVS